MNDELNTRINEIEESIDQDESVASTQATEASSAEDDLDVEAVFKSSSESPKKSASEVAKLKKEAWARNILSGKKTLEDLANTPSDKWMLSSVKKELDIPEDTGDLEERIAAYDNSKQFKQDMEALKSLPIDVKREIVNISKEYLELGVSPEKALRKAMEKSKPILETKEADRKQRVEAGQLPTGKTASGQTVYSADQVSKMSQAEYNKFREMERKGEVVMKLS
jgi:hypothetical protein